MNRFSPGALLLISLLLVGCSSIRTHRPGGEEVVMSEEEFSRYFEEAFRYHNQVMSELIEFASEMKEHPAKNPKKLAEAEKAMITACEPLNEAVTETLEGHGLSLSLKLVLAEAVPACRGASAAVERFLNE